MYPWQQQQSSSFSLRESSSSSAPQKHPAQTDGAPASAAGMEVVDDSSGQNIMPPAKRPREFQSSSTGAPSSWENAYPAPWENRGASAAGGSRFGQGVGQRPAATGSKWGGVSGGAGAMGRGVTNIKFTDTGRSSGGVGAGVTGGGNGGGSATEATGGEGAKDTSFINQFQRSAHIHGGGGAGGMTKGGGGSAVGMNPGMNHMQNLMLQAAAGRQGQVTSARGGLVRVRR